MGAFVVLSSLFFINKTFNLVTPKLNTIFLFTGGYTLVSSIFQYIMIKRDEKAEETKKAEESELKVFEENVIKT